MGCGRKVPELAINTRGSISVIRNTDMASFHGPLAMSTRGTTLKIYAIATVRCTGAMGATIRANGSRAFSMVKASCTFLVRVQNEECSRTTC